MILELAALLLVAWAGAGVVLTREPVRQVVALGFFGVTLAVLFAVYRAPDVALSQIVVGAVVLPLSVLLTLARIRRDAEAHRTRRREAR